MSKKFIPAYFEGVRALFKKQVTCGIILWNKFALTAFLLATCFPVSAHVGISFSILDSESIKINLENTDETKSDKVCLKFMRSLYLNTAGTKKINEWAYRQLLNSEIHESASYLKAARQGNGIYVHLSYFLPQQGCDAVEIVIRARHILWNGRWLSGLARIRGDQAAGKSIFFSDEVKLPVFQGIYFDPAIPETTRRPLQNSFGKIIAFYRNHLRFDPMREIGVIVTIARNNGGYTGYGGDALNIVRISFDNPDKADFEKMDRLFAATFAHELAHKFQNESLFSLPLGIFVTEGSAEFFKVVVLFNAGVISDNEARAIVRKAFESCLKLADSDDLLTRRRKQSVHYREPYDCGMIYYFSAYFEAAVSGKDFVQTLRRALGNKADYAPNDASRCLRYESGCPNSHLAGLAIGSKKSLIAQRDWLMDQIESQQLPTLN